MLDGQSCVLSRNFSSSCDTERDWCIPSYQKEAPKIVKRSFSVEEEDGVVDEEMQDWERIEKKKPRIPTAAAETNNLVLSCNREVEDQSGHQSSDSGRSGDDSLINGLNKDISITCLVHCSRSDYGFIAMVNRSFNMIVRTGELYKLRRKLKIVEHWVYIACSLTQWEAFDPHRRRWMHLPPVPSNECFTLGDKESLAVGTELLVFGKLTIDAHGIWRYSLLTNSWSLGSTMMNPRCLFGSASLDNIAIVAGGCDISGRIYSSAELYDSEIGEWVSLPNMNSPRKMCSGFFMDNKFYVIGGMKSRSEPLTCGEQFDLETQTWTTIPDMSPGRGEAASAPPLVAIVENELYAADISGEYVVKKYDKVGNTWHAVGRLPESANSMRGWGLGFKGFGDRVIVIGGHRGPRNGLTELNAWKPREGPPAWDLLASKELGSFVYNCAVMGC